MRLLHTGLLTLFVLSFPIATRAQLPPGSDPVVDVLFVYNDQARAYMEEAQGGFDAALSAAVGGLNTVLEASGARTRIRTVGVQRVTLGPATLESTLSWLDSGLGEIEALRESTQADVVFALQPRLSDSPICHAVRPLKGYDLRGASGGHVAAAAGTCQFSQAMLRLLGIGRFPGAGDAVRPYGYGYIGATADTSFASVMASEFCGVDCLPVERLSSPAITAFGHPLGRADSSDSVRAVDEGALFVSSYRGCAYDVSGASAISVPAAGGAYPFTITTDAGCASGLPDVSATWMAIGPDVDVVRRGTTSFVAAVSPNTTYLPRTLVLSVGRRLVTFTQSAANDGECESGDVRPAAISTGGASGYVEFEYRAPLGCKVMRQQDMFDALGNPYTSSIDTGWRGLGDVWVPAQFDLGRNESSLAARVTDVRVAGAPLRVTQSPHDCTPLEPVLGWTFSAGAQAVSAALRMPAGCAWSISGLPAWASLDTPASGTGTASVLLRVEGNTGLPRHAMLALHTSAGDYPMRVAQKGTSCNALPLGAPTFTATGGEADATVAFLDGGIGCSWTIGDVPSWVTISPTSGTGPGLVRVSVQPNDGPDRSAAVSVAGDVSSIWQAGAPCTTEVTLPDDVWGAAGGVGRVRVRTRPDCAWSPVLDDWMRSVLSGPSHGDGSFGLQVDPNPGFDRRTRLALTPGSDPVTVTQAGQLGPFPIDGCAAGALSRTTLEAGAHALTLEVHVRGNCGWNVKVSDSWITPVQPEFRFGAHAMPVFVAPNASGVTRTGWIEVDAHRIQVTQAPLFACAYWAPIATVPPGGGSSDIHFAAVRGCPWNVPSGTGVPWLTIAEPGRAYAGSASFGVVAAPNTSGAARVATLDIAGQTLGITQYPDPACRLTFVPDATIVPSDGADVDVHFTMGAGCPWIANVGVPWLTMSGPTEGTGAGRVRVRAAASTFELLRHGPVMVNGQVFRVGQQPYVPSAPSRQYLAEGATGAFFDTNIALLNPWLAPVSATLTFLRSGQPPLTHTIPLPPRQRVDVRPRELPGLSAAEFSTVVDTDRPIAVDRSLRWGGYGSHAETGVAAPGLTWYLAEGATMGGFNLFYLLQNPSEQDAIVTVSYLQGGGVPPLEKTYVVAGNSRQNIWVDIETFDTPEGPRALLAAAEVSGVIQSVNGVPIIVERAMYLDRANEVFSAGHNSAGITAPALQWFLAEGATGPYFDLFVLLANPTDDAARVTVEYLRASGGPLTKVYDVPARSRFNIWVDEEEFESLGKALANAAVSMTLTSTNGVPIVVERAMWWPGDGSGWHEAHNSRGATATGTRWAIAEGDKDPAQGGDTYVLVANTSTHTARVRATYLFAGGFSAVTELQLAPKSRGNMPFPVLNTDGGALRYGVLVESIPDENGRVAQIVVERATYSDAAGVHWAAGSNSLATQLPDH